VTETTTHPTRRTVLKGAAAAAVMTAVGELRMFDAEAAAAPAHKGVFGYGIASGDPTANAVVIWTRATPPAKKGQPVATPGSGHGGPLQVTWQVARDPKFKHIVKHGKVKATAAHDHTVKVDVKGLQPYTRYWYRFSAAGQTSAVGQTQTAPDVADETHALRFALVTCSNYTGGYFTAYRAIAQRNDLDFVLHVGDYIYEYGNGADRYGPKSLKGKRDAQPATEAIDLKGYRLRHAIHKADPDQQAAHKIAPWITIFDDHEVANNSWASGAENHQKDEGAYRKRRQAAYQAYMEWMPFRMPDQDEVPHRGTRFFKRFTYGSLADLTIIETRQNRSKQVDAPDGSTHDGGFIPFGTDPATDAALADPSRHLPEPEQMTWIKDGISQPATWHLIGNQTMLAPIRYPGSVGGFTGVGLNSDQWDGYQADQSELISHIAAQPAEAGDVVVLTGDIHSSWAVDLPAVAAGTTPGADYTPVGVEFVTPSVTSDGFYEGVADRTGYGPGAVALTNTLVVTSVKTQSPWVKYFDGVGHGYALVDVTPDRVQADFFLTPEPTAARPDPRTDPKAMPTYQASWQTVAGSRRISAADGPVGARSDSPA